ncbi:hypothetical protein ACGFIK_00220 [Micromonospora sp. NPDC048871]|uniref:hypothetical protein n=1 Tax=Micromonospora sp. NPDC048871 TaxID=3364259 RepID=UPI00371DA25C
MSTENADATATRSLRRAVLPGVHPDPPLLPLGGIFPSVLDVHDGRSSKNPHHLYPTRAEDGRQVQYLGGDSADLDHATHRQKV